VRSYSGNANARFALVTFDDNVRYSSSSFQTANSILGSNANRWGNFCRGDDEAHYDVAFDEIAEKLDMGRDDTAREVYFISDANPAANHEGMVEAEKVKAFSEGNALLLAAQLGDSAKVNMLDYVSEIRGSSNYYKKASTSAELVPAIEELTTPRFTGGNITIKDPFYLKWKSFEIKELQAGSVFQLEYDEIDRQHYPTGITLFFEYGTDRGEKFQYYSSIFWQ
jgi:hypothetical protein